MSSNEFILNWLNNELKIQPNIKDIAKEFSNGYRFGELLNILNEISSKELEKFKNSKNYKEFKNNFVILKNILHNKLDLYISEEELNSVINHDISAATIILYKIKNSINKKKINFLNINTFSDEPTKEEINKKVKEILDNELYEETNNYNTELLKSKSIDNNNKHFTRNNKQKSKELNSIESDSKEASVSNNSISLNEKFKNLNINIDDSNKNKKTMIYSYKQGLINNNKNKYNSYYNTDNQTFNKNNKWDTGKDKLNFNTLEAIEYNTINNNTRKNKSTSKPFSSNFNFQSISNTSRSNILPKIFPKINTNYEYKSSIMNSNIGFLSRNSIFNQKLKYLTITNSPRELKMDFNNDYGMTKIKEIKNKMQKKIYDIKMEEKLKKEYN